MALIDQLVPLAGDGSDGADNSGQKRIRATVASHHTVITALTQAQSTGGFIVDPADPDYLISS